MCQVLFKKNQLVLKENAKRVNKKKNNKGKLKIKKKVKDPTMHWAKCTVAAQPASPCCLLPRYREAGEVAAIHGPGRHRVGHPPLPSDDKARPGSLPLLTLAPTLPSPSPWSSPTPPFSMPSTTERGRRHISVDPAATEPFRPRHSQPLPPRRP